MRSGSVIAICSPPISDRSAGWAAAPTASAARPAEAISVTPTSRTPGIASSIIATVMSTITKAAARERMAIRVRDVGVTLMASAGLAALAVGAAAQPALRSLIGGLQMAITEPLRIGDLVVVEGHTGRVEEIRMSFVIVRTWDERAVVVPTSSFLEHSFENWSRQSEMLSGPVYLHLDPATEIAPIRAEFERFVATRKEWDGRTAELVMTEAYPESVELRIGVSAATIADLWVLRSDIREHMLEWLRVEMPDALIRHRLGVEEANAAVQQPKG